MKCIHMLSYNLLNNMYVVAVMIFLLFGIFYAVLRFLRHIFSGILTNLPQFYCSGIITVVSYYDVLAQAIVTIVLFCK